LGGFGLLMILLSIIQYKNPQWLRWLSSQVSQVSVERFHWSNLTAIWLTISGTGKFFWRER
jgi:hypothetical protein